MKIWINKVEEDALNCGSEEVLIFNLMNKNNKSNVKTHIEDLWRRFGVSSLSDINEDLIIELHISVSYGVNISAIVESIVNKVRYTVEEATDLKVSKVNVHIDALN